MEWVVNEFITAILIVAFGSAALRGFLSKAPVNFWAGDEIKPEEITDVKAYNRANGLLWAFFTLPQIIAAVLFTINRSAANIFQLGGVLIGIIAAFIAYRLIEKKYRVKTEKGKAN